MNKLCEKIKYSSKGEASTVASQNSRRYKKEQWDHYFCEECQSWHTTSNRSKTARQPQRKTRTKTFQKIKYFLKTYKI